MLSLSSLLNPISIPDPRKGTEQDTASSYYANLIQSAPRIPLQEFSPKPKMSKDGAVFSKGKIKGRVEYPPFERLDRDSVRAVRKFKVFPFGDIAKYPRHIPYNSEKKSFLEKTGRESLEVFQYTFQLPDDEKEYTVMWDYNVGLVRITPFFKCCKYSKTSPAKMLNLNSGLKDITHSITGGALAAQGYWMHYTCARAICATFCAHIAGALIPLFGPNFPNMCIPRDSPDYGKHVIDSAIVKRAAEEAKELRKSLPPSDRAAHGGPTSDPSARQMQMQQQQRARVLPTPSPSTRRGGFESVSPRSVPSDFSLSRGEQRSNGKRIRILRPNGHIEYAASHTDTDSESGSGYPTRPHYRKDREGMNTPMTSPALSYTSSVNGWTPCNLQERMRQNINAFSSNINSSPRATRAQPREDFGALRELTQYAMSTHTPSATPTASPWLSAVPRGDGDMDLRIKLPPILSPPRSDTSTGERIRIRIPPIGLGIRNAGLTPQQSPARRDGAESHKRGREEEKSDMEHEYDADSDASSATSSDHQRAGKRRMKSRDLGQRTEIAREGGRTPLPDLAPGRESGRKHFEEHERNAAVLALLSLSSEDRKDGLGGGLMKRKRCASL